MKFECDCKDADEVAQPPRWNWLGVYNSLDASNTIEVLDAAVRRHGAPEIINSDQGCQYTSKEWHETCEKAWSTTLIITTPDAIIRALIIKFRRPDMRPLSRPK